MRLSVREQDASRHVKAAEVARLADPADFVGRRRDTGAKEPEFKDQRPEGRVGS